MYNYYLISFAGCLRFIVCDIKYDNLDLRFHYDAKRYLNHRLCFYRFCFVLIQLCDWSCIYFLRGFVPDVRPFYL